MKIKLSIATILSVILYIGCQKERMMVDKEAPRIDLDFNGAFPQQCSAIARGSTFIVKVRLKDNVALGSFSLDIHHNFDHHSHSTEVELCSPEAVKTPALPFLYIRSFDLEPGLDVYETNVEINVPADVDTGDYHFTIMVTDKTGWSTQKILSIKII